MVSLESSATDPDRPLHYIGTGVTAAWHRLQNQGAVMLFLGGIGLRLARTQIAPGTFSSVANFAQMKNTQAASIMTKNVPFIRRRVRDHRTTKHRLEFVVACRGFAAAKRKTELRTTAVRKIGRCNAT